MNLTKTVAHCSFRRGKEDARTGEKEQNSDIANPQQARRPIRVADKIPFAQEPGVAAREPIERIEIGASQRNRGTEKPWWQEKPKRQRPSKILKGPVIAEAVNDHVKNANRRADCRDGAERPA